MQIYFAYLAGIIAVAFLSKIYGVVLLIPVLTSSLIAVYYFNQFYIFEYKIKSVVIEKKIENIAGEKLVDLEIDYVKRYPEFCNEPKSKKFENFEKYFSNLSGILYIFIANILPSILGFHYLIYQIDYPGIVKYFLIFILSLFILYFFIYTIKLRKNWEYFKKCEYEKHIKPLWLVKK